MKKNFNKEKKGLFLVILISVIILTFILKKDFDGVVGVLLNIELKWIVLSFLLMQIYWLLEALVYKLFFLSSSVSASFFELFKAVLVNQFFNGITPFSTGGQPFMIYMLNKKIKSSYGEIVSILLQNFIVYQISFVIITIIAICYNNFKVDYISLISFFLNFVIILVFIALMKSTKLIKSLIFKILLFIEKIGILKNKENMNIKIEKFIEDLAKNEKKLSNNKHLFFIMICINMLKFIIYFSITYTVFLALGIYNVSFIKVEIISCYTLLISTIIPSPGASGGAEIGFLALFSGLIKGSKASAIMILWRVFTYYLGLILGLIVAIFEFRKIIYLEEKK